MGVTVRRLRFDSALDRTKAEEDEGFLCYVATRQEHVKDRTARIEKENEDAKLERRMVGTRFCVEVILRLIVTLVCLYVTLIKPDAASDERQWSLAVLAIVFGQSFIAKGFSTSISSTAKAPE